MEPAKAVSEYKAQLEAKDEEIEELHKALGKTTIEKDWAVKKLKSLDYKTKKLLIKPELNISLQGQFNMLGINAIYPHKKKLTSIKDEQHLIYKYLLKKYWTQNGKHKTVHVPKSNEVWSTDITYIRTNSEFIGSVQDSVSASSNS